MLASYYGAAIKAVSNKIFHEEYSSKTFGLRLLLVVYLMNKIINRNSGILRKNNIVKMTHSSHY